MQGPIDHNQFVTIFWAFFFASMAVTATKKVLGLISRTIVYLFNLLIGRKKEMRLRSFASMKRQPGTESGESTGSEVAR